jgi:penicillin amidase
MMDVGRTGSNAFVVHASRSATGGALVASDPHLGLVAPNAWCVVGYSYGDVSVVGLTLPGLPFVVVGRNSDIAWTGTNMQSVSSGLYELPTDFVPTEITRENLRTRLWFDRTREIRQTTIGPVISDAGLFSNLTYGDTALRWRGHMPSDESTAFLKVSTATTWDDFRSAFATYAVGGQNMLFADKEGNIGQILAIEAIPGAAMSARLGAASSDRAASDWDNTIPSTGLPFAFNPPGGLLVSANNTPVLLDPPLVPQGNTNDRLDRITALLSAHDDLDLNVLASIQRDTFSQASLTTAQTMASVASGLDLDLVQLELITTIRQWDGHYEPSSNGAAAYQVLLSALIDKLYADR